MRLTRLTRLIVEAWPLRCRHANFLGGQLWIANVPYKPFWIEALFIKVNDLF